MPESPRWLFSKGKDKQGKEIGNYFALKNGRNLTEEDWDDATFEQVIYLYLLVLYTRILFFLLCE